MSLVELSRWQFALTVMFHMIFPAITVGLSIFLCVVYGRYWRSGNPVYLQMFRFWRRIFAVGFAIGVVAGIVLTFELGLNWGGYATATGPIIGPILAMEVVTAFAVEAGFIGVLLYGDGRVGRSTMFAATVMVSIGTILSSTWIIVANSWMQTPAGYRIVDGQYQPVDWLQVIFNPSFVWRWGHMLAGVLLSAAFLIAGVSAWYLRKARAKAFARRSMSIALGIAAIVIPIQIYLGDAVAGHELPLQPSKVAALEGDWNAGNTGWIIFAIPDQQAARNLVELNIPCFGSVVNHDLSCRTAPPGVTSFPAADRPNVAATFWGFRIMFFASLFMFAAAFTATVLRLRNRLWTARRFHTFLLWLTPVGIIAILAGWLTAEAGRQPWLVFGQLRTEDAVSGLPPGQVLFSMIGFSALYLVMFGAYIVYTVRRVRIGPEPDGELPVGTEPDRAAVTG